MVAKHVDALIDSVVYGAAVVWLAGDRFLGKAVCARRYSPVTTFVTVQLGSKHHKWRSIASPNLN